MTDDRTGEVRKLSHDVRNALHGIAVNLEVARSRAAKGITDPEQIAPFLDNATVQLEAATRIHKEFAALALTLAGASAAPPAKS